MMSKNFFNISDFTKKDLLNILTINTINNRLQNKNIGLIFEKYSTRTRLSFSVGISMLGGNAIDIRFEDLNISRDESFEDTFRAFNCYLDGLVFRTNDHNKLINAAKYFTKPIINALSDQSHPCQILSDLFTLKQHFDTLDINILWMGDMNNVCYSLVEAVNLISEINLTICSPKSISDAREWPKGTNINLVHSLNEINLSSINCVMTDVFVSMNDVDIDGKIDLLKSYCVDSSIMSKTSKNAVFMHCLPAKVGIEVTEEVFSSPQSIVWKQAHNRLVAQNKLLQYMF